MRTARAGTDSTSTPARAPGDPAARVLDRRAPRRRAPGAVRRCRRPQLAPATCSARQAADERRHARFFDRVLREVIGRDAGVGRGARRHPTRRSAELFEAASCHAMASALASRRDRTRSARSGFYHLILEAIVLSTGQDALLCTTSTALPRDRRRRRAACQADERWHIGLGVQLLSESGVGLEWRARRARRRSPRAPGRLEIRDT